MADKKQDNKATPLTEEQLLLREQTLKENEQKLSEEKEIFTLEKNKFEEEKALFEDAKESHRLLEEKTDAELTERENALKAEKEIFEAEKAEFEAGKPEAPKAEEVQEPVELEFDRVSYVFDKDAPKNILINGKGYTQEEIAEDEDLKLQLIGGNSNLIIKKQ